MSTHKARGIVTRRTVVLRKYAVVIVSALQIRLTVVYGVIR